VIVVARQDGWCGPDWSAGFSDISVHQRLADACERRVERHSSKLSGEWRQELDTLLRRSNFFDLPERITQTPNGAGNITIRTEDSIMCIEVYVRGVHKVCGSSADVEFSSEGRRFAIVWNHLVAALPVKDVTSSIPLPE
jgi:hypothetical protein